MHSYSRQSLENWFPWRATVTSWAWPCSSSDDCSGIQTLLRNSDTPKFPICTKMVTLSKTLLFNTSVFGAFSWCLKPFYFYLTGHEETLSRFTLKKLLLLVCFLDKAKESRLIDHDPCLFCMDAEFKVFLFLITSFFFFFFTAVGVKLD